MAGRRPDFENNPELHRFVLTGVRPTGRKLGAGSYGSVEELEVNGAVCAGKRIHETLLEQCSAGVADMARKYLSECQVTAVAVGRRNIVRHIVFFFFFFFFLVEAQNIY